MNKINTWDLVFASIWFLIAIFFGFLLFNLLLFSYLMNFNVSGEIVIKEIFWFVLYIFFWVGGFKRLGLC